MLDVALSDPAPAEPAGTESAHVHQGTSRVPALSAASDRAVNADAAVAPQAARPQASAAATPAAPQREQALPGVQTVWDLRRQAHSDAYGAALLRVQHVSRQVAQLAALLGASDAYDSGVPASSHVSVASMIVREPRLASADIDSVAARLMLLRIKLQGHTDVLHILQSHPSLLLGSADEVR